MSGKRRGRKRGYNNYDEYPHFERKILMPNPNLNNFSVAITLYNGIPYVHIGVGFRNKSISLKKADLSLLKRSLPLIDTAIKKCELVMKESEKQSKNEDPNIYISLPSDEENEVEEEEEDNNEDDYEVIALPSKKKKKNSPMYVAEETFPQSKKSHKKAKYNAVDKATNEYAFSVKANELVVEKPAET